MGEDRRGSLLRNPRNPRQAEEERSNLNQKEHGITDD